jgi:hypothetical protein
MIFHAGNDDKNRDELDFQHVMAELEGLLQITTQAFGVAANQPGQTLKIFEETPDEAMAFQIDLQDMLLQKMNHLETSMVQMKDQLTQPAPDPQDEHPSLFGPL